MKNLLAEPIDAARGCSSFVATLFYERGAALHHVLMGEGEIHVSQDGDDWLVTVEGMSGTVITYPTRREAVEAGERVAKAARAKLRIDSPGKTVESPPVSASTLRGRLAGVN